MILSTLKLPALKTALIVGAVALAIGFGSGFYTKGRFVDAANTRALQEARQTDIRVVANAAQREARVNDALRQNAEFFAFNQAQFDSLSSLVETTEDEPPSGNGPAMACPGDPVLSSDLVRLLNATP